MTKWDFLTAELATLEREGLRVHTRTVESAQGAWVTVDGKRVLNLCANNYLGLANHPRLQEAARAAIERFGVGPAARISRHEGGHALGLKVLQSALLQGVYSSHRVNDQEVTFSRKECAMTKSTILHTGRASLCALGAYLRRRCFFAPLREQVTIPQKTVRYRPIDKRLDALVGILCGAKTIAQSNVTMRTDPAVQRACGRTGCADQSTIARTLRACTADTIAQRERVSWYYLKREGATPRHRVSEDRLWVDVDLTPRPIGAKAEGSARTWMGRNRSTTGRKTLRITASQARERRHETLLRGKATAVPALKSALQEVESRLGWTRERRAQMVVRLDGGFGTTEGLNGLLSRGSQVVATISHSGRVPKGRQHLGPWHPTSSPGREIAPIVRPHRCCRATRPWVMRTPQAKGGDHSAVLLTTVTDLEPAAGAAAYDGRAMIAATFCQDTQALGLVKRRPHTWEAQQVVLLFARLAHHLLLWSKRWLSREPTTRWRFEGYGLVRLLQEVYTVPGGTRWRRGWLVRVRFDPLHPLATVLQQGFAALFGGRVQVRCWR